MLRTSTSSPSMKKTASNNTLSVLVGMPGLVRNGSGSYDFGFNMKNKHKAAVRPETIELDTQEFNTFVAKTLKQHLNACSKVDDHALEVLANLQDQVRSLCKHCGTQGHRLCSFQAQKTCRQCSKNHLDEIAFSLSSIIQMTPSLPPCVTAKVHSSIGLLQQKQGNLKGAIKAFLKALWIQSSMGPGKAFVEQHRGHNHSCKNGLSAQEKAWNLALTRHRLGVCYGKSGNFAEAINQLDYALADYEISQADTDIHKKLMDQAQTELTMFEEANEIEVKLPGSTKKLCVSQRTRQRHSDPLAVAAGLKDVMATVSDMGDDDSEMGGSMRKTFTAPSLHSRGSSFSKSISNLSASLASGLTMSSGADSSNFKWSNNPTSPGRRTAGRRKHTASLSSNRSGARRTNSNPFLSKLSSSMASPSGCHPESTNISSGGKGDISLPEDTSVRSTTRSTLRSGSIGYKRSSTLPADTSVRGTSIGYN